MLKDNKMAGPNEDIARMQMKANRLIDEVGARLISAIIHSTLRSFQGLESTRRMVGLVDEVGHCYHIIILQNKNNSF